MTTLQKVEAGQQIHFLRSGFIHHRVSGSRLTAETSRRGETYTLTQGDIENCDREGRNVWTRYTFDPEAQEARWGHQMFAPGPAPEGLSPWHPDSAGDRDQYRARALDQLAGASIQEREEARHRLDKELGRSTTSTTLNARGGQ